MFIFNQQPRAKIDIQCPKNHFYAVYFCVKDFSQNEMFTLFLYWSCADWVSSHQFEENVWLKKFSVKIALVSTVYVRPKSDRKMWGTLLSTAVARVLENHVCFFCERL